MARKPTQEELKEKFDRYNKNYGRDVRFLAFDSLNKVFVNDVVFTDSGNFAAIGKEEEGLYLYSIGRRDRYHECFFAGLKDIHGKDIFEGHIVKNERISLDPMVVTFENFSVGVRLTHGRQMPFGMLYKEQLENFEILGHIFTEPELFQSQKTE